ncbi:hypothetical protein BJX61DRAFT_184061 [Aspergillus egyptiacus]|nr:hypothetical protein BJX61DRAFT_184061 [Aspergillus egyptiacus]
MDRLNLNETSIVAGSSKSNSLQQGFLYYSDNTRLFAPGPVQLPLLASTAPPLLSLSHILQVPSSSFPLLSDFFFLSFSSSLLCGPQAFSFFIFTVLFLLRHFSIIFNPSRTFVHILIPANDPRPHDPRALPTYPTRLGTLIAPPLLTGTI